MRKMMPTINPALDPSPFFCGSMELSGAEDDVAETSVTVSSMTTSGVVGFLVVVVFTVVVFTGFLGVVTTTQGVEGASVVLLPR